MNIFQKWFRRVLAEAQHAVIWICAAKSKFEPHIVYVYIKCSYEFKNFELQNLQNLKIYPQ